MCEYFLVVPQFRSDKLFPKSENIMEGADFCIECEPEGWPDMFTFTWFKDGQTVFTDEHVLLQPGNSSGIEGATYVYLICRECNV